MAVCWPLEQGVADLSAVPEAQNVQTGLPNAWPDYQTSEHPQNPLKSVGAVDAPQL